MKQMDSSASTRLQVMISTCGDDGIRRVAENRHPVVEGVEYLVGWQTLSENPVVPEVIAGREDFRVLISKEKGLSKNRNFLIRHASAPVLLISDDDLSYTPDNLLTVIRYFEINPDCDILTFRFDSDMAAKKYASFSFPLDNPVKGYYPTSFEIAFRKKILSSRIFFDERFGIGAPFPAGEEEIFLNDCLRKGFKGRYIPETITFHRGATTGPRQKFRKEFISAKGAIFHRLGKSHITARMLIHALRASLEKKSPVFFISYIRFWREGERRFKQFSK